MYTWILVTEMEESAVEVTSIGTIFFFFTFVPIALEPSKTPLKEPKLGASLFLFTCKSLAVVFYSAHVESKKIIVELLQIKEYTLRTQLQ